MRGGAPSWNGRLHVGQQGLLKTDGSLEKSGKLPDEHRGIAKQSSVNHRTCGARDANGQQSSDRMAPAGPNRWPWPNQALKALTPWLRSARLKAKLGETAGLKRAATFGPHIHSRQKALRVARMFYVDGRLAGWRTRPDATHVPVENPRAQKSGRPQTLFSFSRSHATICALEW